MTQEDKKILIKDLCARLPYNVKCYYQFTEKDCTIVGIWGVESVRIEDSIGRGKWETVEVIKPYLRPMSSMTDEEKEELKQEFCMDVREEDNGRHTEEYGYVTVYHNFNNETWYIQYEAIDWLNERHFDYRGLINKGLAIEIKNS